MNYPGQGVCMTWGITLPVILHKDNITKCVTNSPREMEHRAENNDQENVE